MAIDTDTDAGPTRAQLDVLLALAGLDPDDDEREQLAATYATMRPGVEALYAMPEARYEAPALVFQAAPKPERWGA
jgi:hypothetical protein